MTDEIIDIYDPTWRKFAACLGMSTNDFFPGEQSKRVTATIKAACAICKECPVSISCLYEAFVNEYDGIWGGTTYKERQAYIKHMKRNNEGPITHNHCIELLVVNSNK
jgi:WhiB family redox-sensing transcriptional regulator